MSFQRQLQHGTARTALVTASLFAVTLGGSIGAKAEEPIALGVGGYMEQFFGYADNDTDQDHFDQKSDAEVEFSGETTLDNGIMFGAAVVLNGNTDDEEQIAESFAYVEGDFGRAEIGSRDNAAAIMQYAAPDVGIGLNDGDVSDWVENTTSSDADSAFESTFLFLGEDKANKITYFTPRFSGLQVGVSYIPEFERDNNAQPSEDLYENGFAVGVNFVETLGDVDLALAAGFLTASAPNGGDDDAEGYSLGFNVGYAGFTVGGSYAHTEGNAGGGGDTGTSFDGDGYDIGVAYAWDSAAISLSYLHGEVEGLVGTDGDDENDTVMLSGSYGIGPGIDVIGSVFAVDYAGDAAGSDNEGWGIVTGLVLSF
ncbi:porin [Pelagibius sp. Alg239-R121]|uniref:porin n=1 Tax=Pelagibius sp. Alg239-R121 TaxID=2993448 RepID=UPI0024A6EC06|nr:porin [Pelagibius sp. Alg239-R121]